MTKNIIIAALFVISAGSFWKLALGHWALGHWPGHWPWRGVAFPAFRRLRLWAAPQLRVHQILRRATQLDRRRPCHKRRGRALRPARPLDLEVPIRLLQLPEASEERADGIGSRLV